VRKMEKTQRLNPLDEICNEEWDHAVFLTYTHDLLFFEREILRRLREKGCRNISLLVDETAHQETFENLKTIKFLGIEYVVQPMNLGLVFHPKIYLLINSKKSKLIIGSGNLTIPGFFTNKEIFSSYDMDLSKHKNDQVIGSVVSMLNELAIKRGYRSETDTAMKLALANLPKGIDGQDYDLGEGIFLHNLNNSLLEQIEKWFKDSLTGLTVISPYFDTDNRILDRLVQKYNLKRFTLITQDIYNNLDLESVKRIAAKNGLDYELKQLCFATDKKYRNHAKLLIFHTMNEDYVLWGSANFTSAALALTANVGNFETVMFRRTNTNWWMDQFIDEEVTLKPLDESNFKSFPSEGYTATNRTPLRLLDAVLYTTDLVLRVSGEMNAEPITLLFNNEFKYLIEKVGISHYENYLELKITKECVPIIPPLPAFVSIILNEGDGQISSNNVWLNSVFELDRTRTDEAVLRRRELLKKPDFTSKDYVFEVLAYIYNELKLEGKDLPKPIKKVAAARMDIETDHAIEFNYFPDEELEEYEDWVINPMDQYDDELYNHFVKAIYDEIGILNPSNPPNPSKLEKNDHRSITIVLNEGERDRMKERFKGFVRRYIRGITDEDYLARVPIETVLWHYIVITGSFAKLINDNQYEQILDPGLICTEYRELHENLLRALPGRIDTTSSQKFIDDILPVIMADRLSEYFRLQDKGDVSKAANCREWIEYKVKSIEEGIIQFKDYVNEEFVRRILIWSKLFGELGDHNSNEIIILLKNSFGYISSDELEEKLSCIPGVSKALLLKGVVSGAVLESDKQSEYLNRIILSGLYWLLITKQLEKRSFIMVTVINADLTAKRRKVVYLYNRVNKSLYARYVYSNGNEMYFIGNNIDVVNIKDNYRHTTTDVIKEVKESYSAPNDIKYLMGC